MTPGPTLHATGDRRRAKVSTLPIRCVSCAARLSLPGGMLMHGGWLRCDQCHAYTYFVPFVRASGLVFVVEVSAAEIHVLAALEASQREVLRHLGILEDTAA